MVFQFDKVRKNEIYNTNCIQHVLRLHDPLKLNIEQHNFRDM